ncbi:MFS transporter [Roseivirga sp. BDSF3-8]|uniref:MFS transporter n=1 Tax=Roseivirga sp. BDSF3-8 TaxID=3241598 RepID=UPI003531E85F
MRNLLVLMSFLAVVSDTMLHPFYPQFFREAFEITDTRHTGMYMAAICLMVMLAFPFWAWVSRRVPVLRILVYAQLVAAVLCMYLFGTADLTWFWVVSLLMIFCKGSYLLVYPYLMQIIDRQQHSSTIGMLSVIAYFGAIAGAVLGGLMTEVWPPRYIFPVMALGDVAGMGISLYLLRRHRNVATVKAEEEKEAKGMPWSGILRLGAITLLFYFSAFMIRPFFTLYWEAVSGLDNRILSGLTYAIPGLVALVALWWYHRYGGEHESAYGRIIPAMLVGLAGLLLQATPYGWVVIAGRLVYGWAVYLAVVQFDVLLFSLSTPAAYAADYSKVHFFHNLGVLLASFTVGILVDSQGLDIPFYIAAGGFGLTATLFFITYRAQVSSARNTRILST